MKNLNLVFVLISSTILAFAWIGFSLYHIVVTSTINQTLGSQIVPIAPRFNPAAIDAITNRDVTEPTYQLDDSVILTPTVSPASEQPTSSAAAQTSTIEQEVKAP